MRQAFLAAEHYESLAVMAKSSDAVVLGRMTAVEAGRQWTANAHRPDDPLFGETAIARFATVTIEVERIIGEPAYPVDGTIDLEVFLPVDGLIPRLEANLPRERALFFLRNKGPTDSIAFFRLVNDDQGIVREFGGVSHTLGGDDPLAVELDGVDFDELVAEAGAVLE